MVALPSKQGQVVLITGGASGIARATAELFSQNHYKVVIADRSVALGQEVVKNLQANGEEAAFVELDVANEASVQNCVDFAVKTFGGLDCAVNAAGITGPFCPAQETPLEGWQQKLNIDLTGCLMFTKACVNYWLTQEPRTLRDDAELGLPPVTQRGALVNVASFNGLYASKNMVSHVAAKHGVNGISKTFAYELATQGIRVNTVCPGVVLTPIMLGDEVLFAKVKDQFLQGQAMKRFAHPGEIANAIFFLNSDEASFCTGTVMRVDAGWGAK